MYQLKKTVYEIWKPEHVNQRRKEVGPGPIEEYVKRWGIEWKVEHKIKTARLQYYSHVFTES